MMTREQRDMAVAVMKDVVARLDDERSPLNVRRNRSYLYIQDWSRDFPDGNPADLRDVLAKSGGRCEVCLLGAALASKARLFDAVPLASLLDERGFLLPGKREVADALAAVFDAETIDMLEAAFERPTVHTFVVTENIRAAVEFGARFGDDRDRARAIAENVIANDGELVVDPVTEDRAYGVTIR